MIVYSRDDVEDLISRLHENANELGLHIPTLDAIEEGLDNLETGVI